MKQIILLFVLLHNVGTYAATVDTVQIFSPAMHKSIACVVIKPASYQKKKNRYPVVYLLHGYSGNYADWIKKVPELKEQADLYQLLIVCPDGGFSSWYFDSPVDTTVRYETHICKEVVPFVDAQYRTLPKREYRAITGLSMGGHGGLYLGWRHTDLFGACGSMSGGVDLNSSRQKYDISKRIGDTLTYAANWKVMSVINLVEQPLADSLAIIIDCGTEDFFYSTNVQLHQKLLQRNIPHEYTERPGRHNWAYWKNAVSWQLFFFSRFFQRVAADK